MKINVGSKNKTKIRAVREAVLLYPNLFQKPKVMGVDVEVELYGHPKSLKETVEGAIARAKEAYADCSFSFGIEGGLMEVPYSETGFMEVGVCAIYVGDNISLGLSPAFEWPQQVTKLILSNKADASQAFKQLKLTNHEKLGAVSGGIVGRLTNNRITREDYTKHSIVMAVIRLEKNKIYNFK
jgi:inosine/xanthosine triphosphatase